MYSKTKIHFSVINILSRPDDPPEHGYLYAIPAAALMGGYLATAAAVSTWIFVHDE